jgi:hypothetical protein
MNETKALNEKFFILCRQGHVQELSNWLHDHQDSFVINQHEGLGGNTGLHIVAGAENHSAQKAKILIEYGANPSVMNDQDDTPAHKAARAGNLETLKLLVEKGGLSGILMGNSQSQKSRSRGTSRRSVWPSRSRGQCTIQENKTCNNIIKTACEAKNTECVEYLVDEIMKARKSCLGEGLYDSTDSLSPVSMIRHTLDVKEFMTFTVPRQVVFFELGYDLASSNKACTLPQLEQSLYGLMLANTPRAFLHLLNNCIFTMGKRTYVDFLPFFNPDGGSELSILRIITHYKKYELLTHPLCELFLHLKWLRARSLYWIVILLNLVTTFLTIAYVLLSYGNMVGYFKWVPKNETCHYDSELDSLEPTNATLLTDTNYNCYGDKVKVPLLACSTIMALVVFAKMFQDRGYMCDMHLWRHRPEDMMNMFVYVLIIVDQFSLQTTTHRIIGAFLVLGSCRILMHTIARDPDIAIFVEMVEHIKKSIMKFFISYIWLFLGWVVTFHVTLGTDEDSAFRDLGSSVVKVLTMFTGELGFETTFKEQTRLDTDPWTHIWILLLYAMFLIEMCIILMNLTIGLSISNIQASLFLRESFL